MRITINERPVEVPERATVGQLAERFRPGADVFVLNSFPAVASATVQEGDRLTLIRRGERPEVDELRALLAARHSAGVADRLGRATVGIAGCGGLGSTVAVALSRVGIGKLVVADFDVVEPSNLNRQQYTIDQIGLPKVVALAQNLALVNPLVEVEPHEVRLGAANLVAIFHGVDVLVEAFDAADQKVMLVEAMASARPTLPIVLGSGMAGYGGAAALAVRRYGNLWVCGDGVTAAGPNVGLMAPRVGIVAHLQANCVLEALLGPDPRVGAAAGGDR